VDTDPILQDETLFSSRAFPTSLAVPFPQIWNAVFATTVVDPGVDCFVTHGTSIQCSRWLYFELSCDLLRRQPKTNLRPNMCGEFFVLVEFSFIGPPSPFSGYSSSDISSVATGTTVPSNLSRDDGMAPPNDTGNFPYAFLFSDPKFDNLAVDI